MRKGKDQTRETRTSNAATARRGSHRPHSKIHRFLGEVKGSVKDGVNKFRSSDSNSHCPAPLDERALSATIIEAQGAPSGVEVEADTPSALHDAQQAAGHMHPLPGPAITVATADQDLSYSSRFWTSHVRSTVSDHEQLFFWLEVLALINALSGAIGDLLLIPWWLKDHPELKDVSSTAADAQGSIQVFGTMILHSTPHLHASAPPFSPATSPMSRQFSAQFPNTLRVTSRRDINRSAVQTMLKGYTSIGTPVSFSPDGTRIVTGSRDKTVRLWDAGMGQPVGEPLWGHTSEVTSVSFSPDGIRFVSGLEDDTVRLWDAPAVQPSQQCAAPPHPAFLCEDHIMHPNKSTTTMTLNIRFIHFLSNSIYALRNTSDLTEEASYDDRSWTSFLLNRDSGWMPWHCISDTQRMSQV